ncbi:MAG: hypothetical protein ACPG5M_02760 [Winogradskyella sp.]
MRKTYSLLVLLFLFSSCATLLNTKETKVNIYAPKNTNVTLNNETQNVDNAIVKLHPKRSKDSLKLRLSNDSISTDFSFKRRLSGMFYLNLFQTYGLVGMLIDLTNDKRFTYKRNLRFELDAVNNSFYISDKKLHPLTKNTTFIYTSPLRALDVFSQPMLTIGGEYLFTNQMSFSMEYGTIYTKPLRVNSDESVIKNKGRSFRYELKYYNLIKVFNSPKLNEYIGLEARFIRHQFTNNIRYVRTINENINHSIEETLLVHKLVDVFNLKYGLNYPIGKHLFIDLYTGFGLRLKSIKNPNHNYNTDTDRLILIDNFLFFTNDYIESKSSHFNFSLGFKFGVKF